MFNELFIDSVIQKPLDAILYRSELIEEFLKTSETYMTATVLADKQDGIPERLRDLVKELKSNSEDVLDLIHAKKTLHGVDAITQDDIKGEFEGMSWADRQAMKAKRR